MPRVAKDKKKIDIKKLGKKMSAKANDKLTKAKKSAKSVYKRAKNGRVYKLVNGRPRFVSKDEAAKNGFGKPVTKEEAKESK